MVPKGVKSCKEPDSDRCIFEHPENDNEIISGFPPGFTMKSYCMLLFRLGYRIKSICG